MSKHLPKRLYPKDTSGSVVGSSEARRLRRRDHVHESRIVGSMLGALPASIDHGSLQVYSYEGIESCTMMMSDVLVLSIAFFFVFLAVAMNRKYSRSWEKREIENEEYWNNKEVLCPHCDRAYGLDATRKYVIIDVNISVESRIPNLESYDPDSLIDYSSAFTFECSNCGEKACFCRTKGNPVFIGFDSRPRLCRECGEVFSGTPYSACPICESLDSAPFQAPMSAASG